MLRPLPANANIEAIYNGLENGKNAIDGREVRFVHGTLGKILHHKGFDTALIVPQLKEIFDQSVSLGFEEEQKGKVRPDGSVHKSHPNFVGYHHYLAVGVHYFRGIFKCRLEILQILH